MKGDHKGAELNEEVEFLKIKILREIQIMRKTLEKEIIKQNIQGLHNIKIVEISEKLDLLIYEYLLLDKKVNNPLKGQLKH